MTNTSIHRPARVRLRSAALDAKLVRTRRRRSTGIDPTPEASSTDQTVSAEAVAAPEPVAAAVDNTQEPSAPLSRTSKSDIVIGRLQMGQGSSIPDLMEATGWQAHSVRGFLSAVVRKKRGLNLVSEIDADGERRYRIDASVAAAV